MKLLFSTEEFMIKGVIYDGFPLILDQNMELNLNVFDFLIHQCITRGRVQSKYSWKTYGQTMYDFFGFLEANCWDWRSISVDRNSTILVAYRDWSISQLGLNPSTVNSRLRLLIKFYQYALRRSWVQSLPYELEDIYVRQSKGFLAHTKARGGMAVSPNVMLKTKETQVDVLSKNEAKEFLAAIKNPTQFCIAKLALQTGLRKAELCSFPLKYVRNPQNIDSPSSQISVHLDPQFMELKGNKPRTIDVPIGLMSTLWQYVLHERHQLETLTDEKQDTLFLNFYGKPYKATSLNNLWNRLNLPFKVTPHILRHTYATHTLYELRKIKNITVDPLIYVKDRLGHSSITTTQRYLHFLNQVDEVLLNDYQNEIDQLSRTQ